MKITTRRLKQLIREAIREAAVYSPHDQVEAGPEIPDWLVAHMNKLFPEGFAKSAAVRDEIIEFWNSLTPEEKTKHQQLVTTSWD